jgi:hypothetical protein
MVHTCNPSTQEIRKENHELRNSIGYTDRPCLKNKQLARYQWLMSVILATQKAEIGRIEVQSQPGQIV